MLVNLEDLSFRLPVTLSPDDATRATTLLGDAEEIVRDAFARVGRDFDAEAAAAPWLDHAAKRVIRDMVAAAVLIGPSVGRSSVSSTTGAEADAEAFTMDTTRVTGFGRLILTDAHREELGLPVTALPTGRFPLPNSWPERRLR